MQRTYSPIIDPIFNLHTMLEHLVCEVWCNANSDNHCQEMLNVDFEKIYIAYEWLKNDVNAIYDKCITLTNDQRTDIREAFYVNNRIEELCNGILKPIELSMLPDVVEKEMKPLLKKFYKPLLDRSEVLGKKSDYYNKLITKNDYKTCPCCGLVKIESAESDYTEDNDHFFPISKFPFAAVNFKNLVPICDKCNKKHKGPKMPLEHNGLTYYPFGQPHNIIEVTVSIIDSEELNYLNLGEKDLQFTYSGDPNKNATWNWLFNIEDRYNEEIREFTFTELRTIKNRFLLNKDLNQGDTYEAILNFEIENYEADMYIDRKFLKATFLRAIKQKPEWMAVYANVKKI